jgi:group I intron endonuclease
MVESGVYCILNKTNGKRYVGSSVHIRKRWIAHIRELRAGTHYNPYLQASWNKHGEQAFRFVVLCRCLPEDCIEFEQEHIDKYQSANDKLGYNICLIANSPRGVVRSKKVRANMRIGARKRMSNPEYVDKWRQSLATPECKLRHKEALERRQKNPVYVAKLLARSQSQQWKDRLSEAHKRLRQDPAYQEKRRAIDTSPEHRKKMVKVLKEKYADPEYRSKMATMLVERNKSDKQRNALREKWADPEFRARMIAARKANWTDPVKRAKMLKANRATLAAMRANPEHRAKRIAAVVRANANRAR